jgi:PAS domain S-box-containing protein
MARETSLTGKERSIDHDEIIVTKTDTKGRLTYANDVFLRISEVTEDECLGQQHSLIRHPDMPRCVFKLLWDTLQAGEELFAYVVNRALNGDHYWVYAHVTPSIDENGRITGYHSSRRQPDMQIVREHIMPLYKSLLAEEKRHNNSKDGLAASTLSLQKLLDELGMEYDEFVLTLGQSPSDKFGTQPIAKAANG